ncbi:MAG: hypothetical protein WB814_08100, partial [Candidatus Sulfotelmatobacter sp.]
CPEDVLCFERLKESAAKIGFRMEVNYSTPTINRGVVEGVYYKVLSAFPFLCRGLPCTADFIFSKV